MIPVFTLARQHKLIHKELTEAFHRVVDGSTYILGHNVEVFESAFAKYLGVKYAVGVASGTDALTLALLAIDIRQGDEVILPANSYPSAFGVAASGATLRLVDIDPATYNLDPSKLEKAITKKTKAILPVHMYGQPADMKAIMDIAGKHNIAVIEDCAQAHGAAVASQIEHITYNIKQKEGSDEKVWKKVGTIGDIGCYSFYPTKNLGALGDGGMIVTNNKEIYQKVKLLRMYGEKERYQSVLAGRNSRLDELQAAFLLVKLIYLEKWVERRRAIAKMYEFRIQNSEFRNKPQEIQLPVEESYAKHVYHLFVIRLKQRDRLKIYLEKKGIGTAIHYPVPIHLVPSFAYLGYKKGDFPQSERACQEVLSIPIFPELTDREAQKVARIISYFR